MVPEPTPRIRPRICTLDVVPYNVAWNISGDPNIYLTQPTMRSGPELFIQNAKQWIRTIASMVCDATQSISDSVSHGDPNPLRYRT